MIDMPIDETQPIPEPENVPVPDSAPAPDAAQQAPAAEKPEFEQILWTEWLDHYWIETVSVFSPKVFVKACKHKHSTSMHLHRKEISGIVEMTTAYVAGEDGYAYHEIVDRFTGERTMEPVYKVANALGDQGQPSS